MSSSNDTEEEFENRSLFEQLAPEVIEQILKYKVLSVRDVLNVSEVCSYFNGIIRNNDFIWKEKFFQHYSLPSNLILEEMSANYYNELKNSCIYKQQMYTQLGLTINYPGSSELEENFPQEWCRLIQAEWKSSFQFGGALRNRRRKPLLNALEAQELRSSDSLYYVPEIYGSNGYDCIEGPSFRMRKPFDEKPKVYKVHFDD